MIDPGKQIIVVNLFGKHGLKPGVTVYAVKNDKLVGKLEVFRVFNEKKDKFSFCRPVDSDTLQKLAKGDDVQTYLPGESKSNKSNKKENK